MQKSQEKILGKQYLPKWDITKQDPYLQPYQYFYNKIHDQTNLKLHEFQAEGGLDGISRSYKRYGIHQQNGKFVYRQWAPQALYVGIFGQFNEWNRGQYQCVKKDFGQWQCIIDKQIKQYTSLKSQVKIKNGQWVDRIPAWINFTKQNKDHSFEGVYVNLDNYVWKNKKPKWENQALRIYECHIGMAGIQQRVHTFDQFTEKVLPRAASQGYNVVQLMAVIQHPYYGSFGYHCSNFFSVSSRFGSPDSFRKLVDTAHSMGLKVVIDLVHSHAAKNVNEGINMWDGSDYQYFHGGEKGNHPLWDSRVFDYSKYEVLRFLLSNIRFWLQQYQADGFRFDGVTSMLYQHHGKGVGFTGNYTQYFNDNLDIDALVYLQLATTLAKIIDPDVILIAQDVSGFPGLCRSVAEGGIGFGYRLTMAIPDMWIKLLKQKRDEDWKIGQIAFQLTNRRANQKCLTYAQSHDQALVGDKTISMWLFDAEIYTGMSCLQPQSLSVFRGMSLHKLIRLFTFTLGGQGYLCFMGNQFGHPQWIDFPRQGNNWSYHYCRRRWDLADRTDLKYHYLLNFDKKMIALDQKYKFLTNKFQYVRSVRDDHQTAIYERANLLIVINFNPTSSFTDYDIYCSKGSKVTVLFSTDDSDCGGHGRVHHLTYQLSQHDPFVSTFKLYLPTRCGIVLLRN